MNIEENVKIKIFIYVLPAKWKIIRLVCAVISRIFNLKLGEESFLTTHVEENLCNIRLKLRRYNLKSAMK